MSNVNLQAEVDAEMADEAVRMNDPDAIRLSPLDADPLLVLRERDLLKKELAGERAKLKDAHALIDTMSAEIESLVSRVIDPMELATLRGLAAQASRAAGLEAQLDAALTEKQASISVAQLLEERVDTAHEKLDLQGARLKLTLAAMRSLLDALEPVPACVRAVF